MAGIKIDNACIEQFEQLNKKSAISWIIYRLSDDLTKVEIEKLGTHQEAHLESMLAQLPEESPRWVAFHFNYNVGADGKRTKTVLLNWCPSKAPIKQKMVFAATSVAFRRALVGVQIGFEASSKSDITQETVTEQCKRYNKY